MKTHSYHAGLQRFRDWAAEHWSLGVVLAISLILRLGLILFYAPVYYSDTKTYQRLAGQILEGWIHYDGSRTPGYPVFLAIFETDQNAWLVQLGMGVVITLLMYFLGWQLGGNLERRRQRQLAFLAALTHTINLGQLFFKSSLLSETLGTFWLILTMAGWVYGYNVPKARTFWLAGLLGLTSALAILTRGLFIFLPFFTFLLIWLYWSRKSVLPGDEASNAPPDKALPKAFWCGLVSKFKSTYPVLLAYLVPFTLVMGLWVGFIRFYYNQWGLETIGGFRMIQNTGTFFEYVPDEYAAVRDTYLKYREAKIDEAGTQTNVIWGAIPEMMEASGLGFYDLSRLVGKISLQLIRDHPDLYLRNVVKGWWLFWRAPVYWSPEDFRLSGLVPVIEALILVERLLLWGFNIFFLLTSWTAAWPRFRKFMRLSPLHGFSMGMIWSTSIVQAFLDHGDNPRFLIPLQSLVVLWGLWLGLRFLSTERLADKVLLKTK